MIAGSLVATGLLSALWLALAVQDIRLHKLDNVGTLSAFALALGFQLEVHQEDILHYLIALSINLALTLAIYAGGLIGGGDAKLLWSVLAWRPTLDTWIVILACLALAGGAVLAWHRIRIRHDETSSPRRHPLGGAIALAGWIALWIP